MSLHAQLAIRRDEFALDVTIDVGSGETLAVLGPNGAGKSTVLRCILGLEPLDSGRVVVDSRILDDTDTGTFVDPDRRRIGAVFQDLLLFRHLSVVDNVAFGPRARGESTYAARATARAVLERFEIAHLADRHPSQLSGGEAQRVALARALAIGPQAIVLDEPLAALDVTTRRIVRDELGRYLADFPGPRLLVTHDPIDARRLADRVVIIEGGRVTQSGTVTEVASTPASPYVAALFGDGT